MGWTYQQAHGRTPLQVIKDDFQSLDFLATCRDGNAIYAAVARKGKPGIVFGAVFLVQVQNAEVGYKDMSEDDGPYYYGASKRVLDALTEAHTDTAREWRAKCREQLGKPKFKLTEGMNVKFDPPMRFTTGEHLSEFTVVDARRRIFQAATNYGYYRVDARTVKESMASGRLTAI